MVHKTGNKNGFTLIEVIVSLAVLAMLLIPVLSIYTVVTRANTQSQEGQKAINLGQNLMESLERMKLREICESFNNLQSFQVLNCNLNGFPNAYQLKAYNEGGYGEYSRDSGGLVRCYPGDLQSSIQLTGSPPTYQFARGSGKNTYLFGMEGVTEEGSSFDAVITLDATTYGDTVMYPNQMNNYRIPKLSELNQSRVTLLDPEGATITWSDDSPYAIPDFSKSFNAQAVAELYNIWLSYLAYRRDQGLEDPTLMYSFEEIKDALQRDLQIIIRKLDPDKVQVSCRAVYSCSLDLNGDGVSEQLEYTLFSDQYPVDGQSETDREVYLFYTPSGFTRQDILSIWNDGSDSEVFLVKQEGPTARNVLIQKTEQNLAETYVYTNLSDDEMDPVSLLNITRRTIVIREAASNRIYHCKIEIYQTGSISMGDFTKPYAEFSTVWEEEP